MSQFPKSFRYPTSSIFGRFLNWFLNNKAVEKYCRTLNPIFANTPLQSNITDVVYLNWMVSLEKVAHLVPKGMSLESNDGMTLLSILTYKHGHFGPKSIPVIRSIFGSPYQSNWRLYLNSKNLPESLPTVLFISNVISSRLYTIGSRIFSNIMQTHYPASFEHGKSEATYQTKIISGFSNSSDLEFSGEVSQDWEIPESFLKLTQNREDLLAKITFQDFAISDLDTETYALAQIHLGFDLKDILPLQNLHVESKTLAYLIQNSECFAFVIPNVDFTTIKEKIIQK